MKIPNIIESLHDKLESGAMTMDEVKYELCGWFTYIPDTNQVYNLFSKYYARK